ncbi:MAG: hypothetical protein H5T50_10820, partial [Nitrososphaeria archaeon]|nr:hypothetical protein [Nitrososphaeria archaeon]
MFNQASEQIYIIDDKLVITLSYLDTCLDKILPNEWIIIFDRNEIFDVELEGDNLVLITKNGKKVKVNVSNLEETYAK